MNVAVNGREGRVKGKYKRINKRELILLKKTKNTFFLLNTNISLRHTPTLIIFLFFNIKINLKNNIKIKKKKCII